MGIRGSYYCPKNRIVFCSKTALFVKVGIST